MSYTGFDIYAKEYDQWFIENSNVFETELRLVASCLKESKKILSIGCGSGLFEKALKDDYNISIKHGIEPSQSMADIAIKRGINVEINTGEDANYGDNCYDTILFNGCPCYMNDLKKALIKAKKAVTKGGRIIIIDVPKESGYGTLYNLALSVGSWEHPLLEGIQPHLPYPIELVKQAKWRTTAEKINILQEIGLSNLSFKQTLTTHPCFSHLQIEEPIDGYDKGSYVAITAIKD